MRILINKTPYVWPTLGFTRHVTKLPKQFKIIAEIIEASQSQLIV